MHDERGSVSGEGGMHGKGGVVKGTCVTRGACVAFVVEGGMQGRGHVLQGVCMAGGMHGRRDGHCRGRYASYWNALLFQSILFVFHPTFLSL